MLAAALSTLTCLTDCPYHCHCHHAWGYAWARPHRLPGCLAAPPPQVHGLRDVEEPDGCQRAEWKVAIRSGLQRDRVRPSVLRARRRRLRIQHFVSARQRQADVHRMLDLGQPDHLEDPSVRWASRWGLFGKGALSSVVRAFQANNPCLSCCCARPRFASRLASPHFPTYRKRLARSSGMW